VTLASLTDKTTADSNKRPEKKDFRRMMCGNDKAIFSPDLPTTAVCLIVPATLAKATALLHNPH
jgi:hypothetical protein